ncbi:SMP-30/gluconolactonase/LRE family protein [Novosphingobium flavum]|uniref:SMP-30/gluconolactonase/LRE family protein n=1 Tax=Novosphingobium flavum TaxID=1778672 RepID=A0A7X1KLL6_9SPHN|nr:SMP-30/gluconolactonase/LRE family protein [Novosphingobium flavum]MBC2665355.1 SMP-30/gluconolactonase/LRE family protein [Novosphingobium flavum]
MRRTVLIFGMCLSVQASLLAAAEPAPAEVQMTQATGIRGVIAANATLELVAEGFKGTEGVVGMPDGSVLFCEQNADRIIHLDLDGKSTLYLDKANRSIGLAIDRSGRLVSAQSQDPMVGTLAPRRAVLVASFNAQPLVKPNDLVIDRKGGIYFTDPLPKPGFAFREPPPGRKPLLLYRSPGGKIFSLSDGVAEPNGIQLSPDEKTLYAVNGSHIDAFDIVAPGVLARQRVFAEVAGDGLAVDNQGRLYAATRTGVEVIGSNGRRLGHIAAPVRVQSVAFAGRDRRFLYAVGEGKVFRIRTLAPGVLTRWK